MNEEQALPLNILVQRDGCLLSVRQGPFDKRIMAVVMFWPCLGPRFKDTKKCLIEVLPSYEQSIK